MRRHVTSHSTSRAESAAALPSNAALAEQIIANDASAFATLVNRYHSFVYQICFGILRHRQDAEDATQDTFTRVAKYLDRWDPRRPLEPWLATVAGNRSRTQLARRRPHAPLSAAVEPETNGAMQSQAAEAMREEIRLAMSHLPDRQRQAFEWFHEHSLSYNSIANRMNCPVGTAKTLVHRARKAMIEQLRKREVVLGRHAGVARHGESK